MGPFTTKEKGRFYVDHKDDAVRGALVTQDGHVLWPPPQKEVGQYFPADPVTGSIPQ